MTAVMAETSSQ